MRLLVIAAALLLSACTTSFTNMTPTKALDPVDFELSARMQGNAHGSVIRKTIDGGDEARDIILDDTSTDDITEEQLRDFLDAGLAWFMFKPGVSTELSARIGRINVSPENIQQALIGYLFGVVNDLHGFQMPGAAG